ncbi:MAG: FCD domain-containing protein [Terrimesophilobacter sp.]
MAFESCVEQLGSAIQLGVFREGSKLPSERDLAERLSVSRATLREAVSALRSAGFVTTTRGRGGGTVVESLENARPFDRTRNKDRQEEINDILIFRATIEPGACFQAASTVLSEEARALLRTCLADLDQPLAPADYRQADARLHLAIASVCNSRRLAKASSTIQTKIHDYLAEIPFLRTNIVNSDAQHKQIIQAILEGDAETARSVMGEHCGATASLLKGLLK